MSEPAPRDVDAAPVAWREAGAGPTVLFLHGLGMTRTGFDPQLAALADRFRCVAWDMPGYGASPPPAGAADVPRAGGGGRRACSTRSGSPTRTSSASRWAAWSRCTPRSSTRGACARWRCSTPARPSASTARSPTRWRRARLAPLDEGATPATMAEPVLRSIMAPGTAEDVVAAAAASMARIPAAGLRAAVECLPSHDVRARLGEIRVPTLVRGGRAGRGDAAVLRRALADGIPGAELVIVPGAGHIAEPRGARRGQRAAALPPRRRRAGRRVTEWRWIEAFTAQLEACALRAGEVVAILLGVVQPARARRHQPPRGAAARRSGGGRRGADAGEPRPGAHPLDGRVDRAAGQPRRVAALAAADLVVDCTVEGLIHAPELGTILGGGARVLMISNEHPENFERFAFDPTLAERVERGVALLTSARRAAGDVRRGQRPAGAAGGRLRGRLLGRRHGARRPRALARRALRLLPGHRAARTARSCSRPATSTSRSRATSATR